jgi:hypothetical protein
MVGSWWLMNVIVNTATNLNERLTAARLTTSQRESSPKRRNFFADSSTEVAGPNLGPHRKGAIFWFLTGHFCDLLSTRQLTSRRAGRSGKADGYPGSLCRPVPLRRDVDASKRLHWRRLHAVEPYHWQAIRLAG